MAACLVLIAGLLTTLLASPVLAAPKPADADRATFGIGAANATGLDGRPYLRYAASPGAFAADHIMVRNLGAKPLTLLVYTTVAVPSSDGDLGFASRTAKPEGDAAWLTVGTPGGRQTVSLAPRSSKILPVTLRIPEHASPGDHTLAVIASVTSKIKSESGQSLDFEQRVALRTFIRVSGALQPSLAIDHVKVSYTASSLLTGRGRVTVTYVVRNDGNLNLAARPTMTVRGPLGSTGKAQAQADLPIMLPGSSVPAKVVVPNVLAQFWMHAKVTVMPLQIAGDVDPPMAPVTADVQFVAVPWLLIFVLGLLLILLALWIWRRRRRKRTPGPKHRPDGGGNRSPSTLPAPLQPVVTARHTKIAEEVAP